MTDTKFSAGISGNPAGRPKDKTPATMLRKSLADDMPYIITKLVELAKNGDVSAAKVLIDRVCPSLKPQSLPICLPVNGSLSQQGAEIISATLAGHIAPDTGGHLISALATQAKLVESIDLLKRIEALEDKSK